MLEPGGTFGLDLVPDVPNWREYSNRVQLRGPAARGVHLTLIESVRQDRARRLTTFEQRYVERRDGRSRSTRFELTFRTLSVQADDGTGSIAPALSSIACWATTAAALGRARGCLDHPREKEVEFSSQF